MNQRKQNNYGITAGEKYIKNKNEQSNLPNN